MARYKKIDKQEHQSVLKEKAFPHSVNEHAAQLEQDFSIVDEKQKGIYCIRWSKATRKLLKNGIEDAIISSSFTNAAEQLSTEQGRETFSNLILGNIGIEIQDEIVPSVPRADFFALRRSYQDLVCKIRAQHSEPTENDQFSQNLTVSAAAKQDTENSLCAQVTSVSADYRRLTSSDNEVSDYSNESSAQAGPSPIRLQGSLDLSADDDEDEVEQGSDNSSQREIKEEKDDDAEIMALPDPAIFTISLGIPLRADDYTFAIAFKDERVSNGLGLIPAREVWQLVRDAIFHDPDIPQRTPALPWITQVKQLEEGCLAFRTKTEEDLNTVTSNVQWARDLRDTVSAGVKTYKVVLENLKIPRVKIEGYGVTSSFIGKLREENLRRIPSLDRIGVIRDVVKLPDRTLKRALDDYEDFVLVFGSREAANAALNVGLRYLNKVHTCVIHSPETQWHQQCSNCQGHDHTTNRCRSAATCGKCGYKHQTQYCTSATLTCANCQGEHMASSKTCVEWLEAEEKAHRAYRFPADEDDCAKAKAAATTPPPGLPLSVRQKPQETFNEKLKVLPPPVSQKPQGPLYNESAFIDDDQLLPSTPSVLLQTIDEFRAFVAARESANNQNTKKRHNQIESEMPATSQTNARKEKRRRETVETGYMMTGALQTNGYGGKRAKMQMEEEEGPVWPTGQRDYHPPSLRQPPS